MGVEIAKPEPFERSASQKKPDGLPKSELLILFELAPCITLMLLLEFLNIGANTFTTAHS